MQITGLVWIKVIDNLLRDIQLISIDVIYHKYIEIAYKL